MIVFQILSCYLQFTLKAHKFFVCFFLFVIIIEFLNPSVAVVDCGIERRYLC